MSLQLVLAESASAQAVAARSFSLRGKPRVVIGRDPAADWQLPDAIRLVSSKHCEILTEGATVWLHDQSTNGTFINGAPQRIAAPHRLTAGDRIRIGNYIIAVEADEAADASDDTIAVRPRNLPAAPAPMAAAPESLRGADPASMAASRPAGGHGATAVEEMTMIAPAPAAKPAGHAKPAPAEPAPADALPPLVKHFARGLGLPEADIALADTVKLAEHAGALLRSLTAGLMPLLSATAAHASPPAPGMPRNPLEDAPNPPAALEMLFGPPRRAYLDAERAYKVTLQELLDRAERAARPAAAGRGDEFSPAEIERQFAAAGKHARFLSSRKAALWDFYVARWESK
jgi:type VI secretion system protein ImpI